MYMASARAYCCKAYFMGSVIDTLLFALIKKKCWDDFKV